MNNVSVKLSLFGVKCFSEHRLCCRESTFYCIFTVLRLPIWSAQSDLILSNFDLGFFTLWNITLGTLSQCSPTLGFDTMGKITEWFYYWVTLFSKTLPCVPFPKVLPLLIIPNVLQHCGMLQLVIFWVVLPWVILTLCNFTMCNISQCSPTLGLWLVTLTP